MSFLVAMFKWHQQKSLLVDFCVRKINCNYLSNCRYILLFTWSFSDCIPVFLTAYILHLKVTFISAIQSPNLKTNQAYVCKICAYFNCCIKCKYISCILHNPHSLTNTIVIYQLLRFKNLGCRLKIKICTKMVAWDTSYILIPRKRKYQLGSFLDAALLMEDTLRYFYTSDQKFQQIHIESYP